MQRMLGAQSSLILQGLWQLTAHKSRRTLLRTKYLIQSQQQFAKRLTFIFYFGSKKIKGIPRLSKLSATSLQHTKQPFHLCCTGHRCAGGLLQTHSLIPPSQGGGKKHQWADGAQTALLGGMIFTSPVFSSRGREHLNYAHVVIHGHIIIQAGDQSQYSHLWRMTNVAHHLHGLGLVPQMKLRGTERSFYFSRGQRLPEWSHNLKNTGTQGLINQQALALIQGSFFTCGHFSHVGIQGYWCTSTFG